MDATGGEDGVDDGAFLSGFGMADKGPVALADFGGAELGFEQVGIEESVSVTEAFEQAGPSP